MDTHLGPSPAEVPCLVEEGSFSCFAQSKRKLKLKLKQHKLYSMAREWRSRNLVHKSISRLNGKKDLLLRRKDNVGRSETNMHSFSGKE